ncbi:hypothetical protein MPTK1_1g25360 [Marchantia polymorpha subsp. ruderalis]|uniref:Thaumatin-like protein n=2 Tax=Marchantia polymorpha TaxID=3197 RepID=A0AAF6AU58_MARPO|nr:hypothetical protein MARPO_0002s0336 [Marchantia polymorpha]BBM99978.1 hypothetical protein Mp_1g25360 [Marchantia polymorpha subsp. ruderalis]|eukprot:PTQ49901.1 hypothetical protein MARPO_0002s0336 [Marchantia polymorpha]
MAPVALKLFVVLVLASVAIDAVHGCGINVRNACGYSVTTCAQNQQNRVNQYNLGPGASVWLDFGSGCKWIAGTVWASVKGQCAAPSSAFAANDRNLANLAEFTIGDGSGSDFYDLSNVNAYTIPLSIRVINRVGGGDNLNDFRCGAPKCVINDIRGFCKGNNQLVTLPSGALSCINTDGTNGRGPTDGTRLFKQACQDSYSYNYDDPTSTFTCGTGSNYEVTFCPGNGLVSDE